MSTLCKTLNIDYKGSPMGRLSHEYWHVDLHCDTELGTLVTHAELPLGDIAPPHTCHPAPGDASLNLDPALSAYLLESKLLEAINDALLRSPSDFRARLQAMAKAIPNPTLIGQGIPISMLVSAIALNAIPNLDLAVSLCSSADVIMARVSAAGRSAVRVLGKPSCTRAGESSDLQEEDWITIDVPEVEASGELAAA
ncbi:hypothetical protein BDV93DRAFT_227041 [Ceratobasidium sp. AG-I]|nr:hypothetical protein BDV93DRAFT_227041 [Ceratobasidium sp. AG-I]